MTQQHVPTTPAPNVRIQRAAYLTMVAIYALLFIPGSIPIAYYLGLPFGIGLALTVPVFLASAVVQRSDEIPPAACALVLGTPGLIAVVIALGAQAFAVQFSLAPPAALELPLSVLAWIGVVILAISDLLFVAVVSSALLTRLRTSA